MYPALRTSSRQAGDIHAPWLDTEVTHDLAGDARKERGSMKLALSADKRLRSSSIDMGADAIWWILATHLARRA